MSAPLAMAFPPAPVISATTCPAGPVSVPDPSSAAPRSLTTTDAPCLASSSATDRPIPRPDPVTIATRESKAPTSTPAFPALRRCQGSGNSRISFWNQPLDRNRGCQAVPGRAPSPRGQPGRCPDEGRGGSRRIGVSDGEAAHEQGDGRRLAVATDGPDPAGAAERGPRGLHRAGLHG